jgi:S1-C subfamily serine protease
MKRIIEGCKIFMTFLLVLSFASYAPAFDLRETSRAIVSLVITQQGWDVLQPWTKRLADRVTCTGFFVSQGILTNAHCVSNATFIEVEIQGYPNKVEAIVSAVNHQLDLALIKLQSSKRIPKISPITFGEIPEQREKIVAVGYPTGGQQLSYTEGVVSRIDMISYAHSSIANLMIQIDAAINPGNSGSPVFSDLTGSCIGVATQTLSNAEGVGYVIPTPVIEQFLKDFKDGTINGIPGLGIFYQSLENQAIRRYLNLNPKQKGIRVQNIARGSTADEHLQIDDVLTAIDGHPIFNDGRTPFLGNSMIDFRYYVHTKQVGESITLTISRNGAVQKLSMPLKSYRSTIIPEMIDYDQKPRYRVVGGLVFLAVDQRYLWSWGENWWAIISETFKRYLRAPVGEEGLEELVIISTVFDASVNNGYRGIIENVRVKSVNGITIASFDDLSVGFTTEKNLLFHEIELENGFKIILDRAQITSEDDSIQERYNISDNQNNDFQKQSKILESKKEIN